MGNLNCCANNSGAAGMEQFGQDAQQQNFNTVNAQITPSEQPRENDLQEAQPEVNQEALKQEQKMLDTEFPERSFTENIKARVTEFQPALIAVLKELDLVLATINVIYDPTEQIVVMKDLLNNLNVSISSFNNYWIGFYEVYAHETVQFVQSLETQLRELNKYFSELTATAESAEKKANETTHSLFKLSLATDDNVNKLSDFNKEFETFHKQFLGYSTIRTQLDSTVSEQFLMQIPNIKEDIQSWLPAYIRHHYKSHPGFPTWDRLFPGSVEISKTEFSEVFAKESGIEVEKIQFIIKSLNTLSESIHLAEYTHFVKQNAELFNEQGLINSEKFSEIDAIIEKLSEEQEEQRPTQSENIWTFSTGATFEGELVEGLRSGKGKYVAKDYTLEGEFVEGRVHGFATQTRFGISYEGNFVNGLFDGEGSLKFPDGTTYNGNFCSGKFQGKGTLTHFNNITVSGEFQNGNIAQGEITYPTGQTYTGPIVYNRFRSGAGVLKQGETTIFNGTFLNDEPSEGELFLGNGELLFKGTLNTHFKTTGTFHYIGGSYTGEVRIESQWRIDQGKLTWDNGVQEIEGTWVRDAPAQATNFFDTANRDSRYEGQWENFNRHGKGIFFYASGAKYEGDIVRNLRSGKGKYTFKNGNIYEGDWAENDFNGEGVFTFANGDVYTGGFKAGAFHGVGKYVYKNQNAYEGEWQSDKWHGKGKYMNAKGEVIKEGIWVDEKLQTSTAQNPEQ